MENAEISLRKEAIASSKKMLGENGRLPLLIATFLFLITAAVAIFSLSEGILYVCVTADFVQYPLLLSAGLDVICGMLVFFLLLPLCFGRLNLAGRMCEGESPVFKDVFCFFVSKKSYRRALSVAFFLALELLAAVVLIFGVALGYVALFGEIDEFADMAAGVLLCVFTGLLLLTTFPFVAVALGNPRLSVGRAFRLSVSIGFRNYGKILCFLFSHMWRLAVGILTVGVLQLLWFDHLFILSYLRFSMALCPKGELQ